jgi:2-polyprenyl-3-methyl-5-hydroxy-6-metoxy-1,4-benzoquinol methylase
MDRVRPGDISVKAIMQRAKYAYARRYAHGVRVLDLGCGSGAGTDTLAEVATECWGVERNQEALSHAKQTSSAAYYISGDVTRRLSFLDHDFGLVTAMDVIEHLPSTVGFFENVTNAIAPGGVFILTTPNVAKTGGTNPHHVHEFASHELEALLRGYFSTVVLLGMEKNDKSRIVMRIHTADSYNFRFFIPKPTRNWLRRLLRIPPLEDLGPQHYPITGDLERAYSFVAVCREPL